MAMASIVLVMLLILGQTFMALETQKISDSDRSEIAMANRQAIEDGPAESLFVFPQLNDLTDRIRHAKYPRIGQSWSRATNLAEDIETTIARHDLYFTNAESFGLKWKVLPGYGEAAEFDQCSIEAAKAKRTRLLLQNPNMVMLTEIRYYDAKGNLFPVDSPFWQHDAGKQIINKEYPQCLKLDYTNQQFQDHVAAQARAALQSGVVDGVMLDWWQEGKQSSDDRVRLALLKKVRAAVGPDALIMINTNECKMSQQTMALVNGYYMECYKTKKVHSEKDAHEEWKEIKETLAYAEENCRTPHINMVETWWEEGSVSTRGEVDKMRATATLAITQSDGYALFADRDHGHNWYPFWSTNLGKPLATGAAFADGTFRREFEQATVVSNAIGDKPVVVKFSQDRQSVSDGKTVRAGEGCTVNSHDGEIFLKIAQ
jgi:Hypothetical glycosyl hydrolase family 15